MLLVCLQSRGGLDDDRVRRFLDFYDLVVVFVSGTEHVP